MNRSHWLRWLPKRNGWTPAKRNAPMGRSLRVEWLEDRTVPAPFAANDTFATAPDTLLTVPASGVLANDDGQGQSITAVPGSGPSHGTLTLNPDGSFSYSPASGFVGMDTFTYKAFDGSANSNSATVNISVGTFAFLSLSTSSNTIYAGSSSSPTNVTGVTARLVEMPSNTPITGELLTLNLGGDSTPVQIQTLTNANGEISDPNVVWSSAGVKTLTASFAGNAQLGAASASTSVTVLRAATAFVPVRIPPNGQVGANFSASVQLNRTSPMAGPVAGVTVTFTFRNPSNTLVGTRTGVTDSNGLATTAFTLTPAMVGASTLTISAAATSTLAAPINLVVPFTVSKLPSTYLTASPVTGVYGRREELTAYATDAGGTPIPNLPISFATPSGTVSATTDATGKATAFVTPLSAITSTYTVSYDGTGGRQTASATNTFAIRKIITSLSTPEVISSSTPSVHYLGDSPIAVSTELRAVDAPGAGPLAGAVAFTVTKPDGTTVTIFTTALANGRATASFLPTMRGPYTVFASYDGQENYFEPSQTLSTSITAFMKVDLQIQSTTGVEGSPTTISARLLQTTGADVRDVKPVSFDFGGVVPSGSALTDANGVATLARTFPAAGTYPFTASFFDVADYFVDRNGNQLPTTVSGTVTISGAPLIPGTLTAPEVDFTQAVTIAAPFSDANLLSASGEFFGTIAWGDGQTTDFNSSSVSGSAGQFTVAGSHLYAGAGSFVITVTVRDTGGSSAVIAGTAVVQRAPTTTKTFGAGPFVYDGTTFEGGSGQVTGSDLNGPASTIVYAANPDGTGNADRVNAGTYYAIARFDGDANYLPSVGLPVAITIAPRTLSVAAEPKVKGYGSPDPALTFQIAGGTLVGSDAISGSLTRGPGEEPGHYPIRLGTLSASSNYQIDYVGSDLTIELMPSTIQGMVWVDFNNDGLIDMNEQGIAGVTVALSGTDAAGLSVNRTAVTDSTGVYSFANVRPGNAAGYTITETQPAEWLDGREALGTVNGTPTGTIAGNDQFSGIVLMGASLAENYNFGERPPSGGSITGGQTAVVGFWQNNKGQTLIKSLNGGATATQLGTWLAATFPNMYGELAGKTNAEVAKYYKSVFTLNPRTAPDGPAKMDAQVMATALSVYVTNATLAGNTAVAYGFQVSEFGLGVRTVMTGSNCAAFGVAGTTSLSVLDLLLIVNGRSRNGLLFDLDGNGLIDATEASYRTMANNLFGEINKSGSI